MFNMLEPIYPIVVRMRDELRKLYPGVKPWDDTQSWEYDPNDVPLPKTWGVVVFVNEQFADITIDRFRYLPDDSFSMAVMSASGPQRVFVTGWDVKFTVSRVVTRRIFNAD